MSRNGTVPRVLKFGGASLDDPSALVRDVRTARASAPSLVLVVSARSRVTDLLVEAVEHPRDRRRHQRILASIDEQVGDPGSGRDDQDERRR